MSFKVVDIHTKEPIFDSWLEEVYKANNLRKTKKPCCYGKTRTNIIWLR